MIWFPVALMLAATPAAQPPAAAAGPDTTLCALISAKDFFGALKAPVGTVKAKTGTVRGTPMVNGIGSAAFWGTDKDSDDALELNMRKGNVIVGLLLNGKSADASVLLPAAQQMAKEIAAHF